MIMTPFISYDFDVSLQGSGLLLTHLVECVSDMPFSGMIGSKKRNSQSFFRDPSAGQATGNVFSLLCD